MKLYYAQAKDSTDTLMVKGETLLVSNPSVLKLVMKVAEKRCGKDIANTHTIKSVEACIVRTEEEQRESFRETMREILDSMNSLANKK